MTAISLWLFYLASLRPRSNLYAFQAICLELEAKVKSKIKAKAEAEIVYFGSKTGGPEMFIAAILAGIVFLRLAAVLSPAAPVAAACKPAGLYRGAISCPHTSVPANARVIG